MLFKDVDEYNNAEAGGFHVALNKAEKMEITGLIMNVSYEKQDNYYLVYVFAGHEDYWELLNMVDSTSIYCVYADIKLELKSYIKAHLEEWRDKMAELVAEDLRPKSYVDNTAAFYDLVIANKGRFAIVQYSDRAEIYEQTQFGYKQKRSLEGKYNPKDIINMLENDEEFVQTAESVEEDFFLSNTEVTLQDYL